MMKIYMWIMTFLYIAFSEVKLYNIYSYGSTFRSTIG
jgi:hypothetical protein